MALLQNWLNTDLFSAMRDKVNAIVTAVNNLAGGAVGFHPVKASSTDFNYVQREAITCWTAQVAWNMDANVTQVVRIFMTGSPDTPQQFLEKIISYEVFIYENPAAVGGNRKYVLNTYQQFVNQGGVYTPFDIHPANDSLNITLARRDATGFDNATFVNAVAVIHLLKRGI